MLYVSLKVLHLLAILVWVGGMVFAHFFFRPAVGALQPDARVRLMHAVLGRFFVAVLWAATLTLITGIWMIGSTASQMAHVGARFAMPLAWTVMATLGILMMMIFGHIRFVLYNRLDRAMHAADWPTGAGALAQIRQWVVVNMALGLGIILVLRFGLSF
jgi:uncharacterized membrane protein